MWLGLRCHWDFILLSFLSPLRRTRKKMRLLRGVCLGSFVTEFSCYIWAIIDGCYHQFFRLHSSKKAKLSKMKNKGISFEYLYHHRARWFMYPYWTLQIKKIRSFGSRKINMWTYILLTLNQVSCNLGFRSLALTLTRMFKQMVVQTLVLCFFRSGVHFSCDL